MDFSSCFIEVWNIYQNNTLVFKQTQAGLNRLTDYTDGAPSLGANYYSAILLIDAMLGESTLGGIELLHSQIKAKEIPTFNAFNDDFRDELLKFTNFWGVLHENTVNERKTTERQAVVALKSFKSAILSKPIKSARILTDWITKWASYIPQEKSFTPEHLKAYKQHEIILADFGFNLDGEFGGRHYAVVLEKNNSPKSSVILVAPITSYDTSKGQKLHPANIDLGIGAIHGYSKGAEVVTNQIRYISKMRIEKPKTSKEPRIYMDKNKFEELLDKIKTRLLS